MKAIALGLVMALALATASQATDLKKLDQIAPGDSRARVIEVMGPPGNRQLQDTREALQWCKSGLFTNYFGLVVLHDGKVFSIKTANSGSEGGSCSRGYPTIDWIIDPKKAVEIINR